MVIHSKGFKVNKPIFYQRKCPHCGAILKLNYSEVDFGNPNHVPCTCGTIVPFTSGNGIVLPDVSFIYTKEQDNG